MALAAAVASILNDHPAGDLVHLNFHHRLRHHHILPVVVHIVVNYRLIVEEDGKGGLLHWSFCDFSSLHRRLLFDIKVYLVDETRRLLIGNVLDRKLVLRPIGRHVLNVWRRHGVFRSKSLRLR